MRRDGKGRQREAKGGEGWEGWERMRKNEKGQDLGKEMCEVSGTSQEAEEGSDDLVPALGLLSLCFPL